MTYRLRIPRTLPTAPFHKKIWTRAGPEFLMDEGKLFIVVSVGDYGKTERENGAMECPNIGVRRGMYDNVKLEKGEMSRAVRSYANVTREDVQTPLGQNRLIIP